MIEFCLVPAFFLWHVLHEGTSPFSVNKYPPPSGRHAMRCLYVIGRDGWVRDMSNTQWLEMDSSHRVGECSVTAVCPLAGVYSRRRLCENYCCCCCCCCFFQAQEMEERDVEVTSSLRSPQACPLCKPCEGSALQVLWEGWRGDVT